MNVTEMNNQVEKLFSDVHLQRNKAIYSQIRIIDMESESELLVAPPKNEVAHQHSLQVPAKDGTNNQSDGAPSLEPVRTEPVKMLEPRKRRLDRQFEEKIPEIHMIGEIRDASGICLDLSEGLFVRWKFEHGKIWQHLGGELSGQTHVAYCKYNIAEEIILNHPIDMHFAVAGLQGWGSPRIVIQAFRVDWFGRRIVAGCGFVHMPLIPGQHSLDIPLWRPIGTPEQELQAFLLGDSPALANPDPIYESAWKDRCRLMTTSAGNITIRVSIITRFMREQGLA